MPHVVAGDLLQVPDTYNCLVLPYHEPVIEVISVFFRRLNVSSANRGGFHRTLCPHQEDPCFAKCALKAIQAVLVGLRCVLCVQWEHSVQP